MRSAVFTPCAIRSILVLNSAFLIAINEDEADFYRAGGLTSDRTLITGPGMELAELAGGDGARLRQRFGLEGPVVGVLSAMAYDKRGHGARRRSCPRFVAARPCDRPRARQALC